jgi:hypothetical protein
MVVPPANLEEEDRSQFYNLREKQFGYEYLVPITLNLSIDNFDLRDSFAWSLKGSDNFISFNNVPLHSLQSFTPPEQHMTPERFARIMVDDLLLPETFLVPIAESITQQLNEQRSAILTKHEMQLYNPQSDDISYSEELEEFPPPPPLSPPPREDKLCLIQVT